MDRYYISHIGASGANVKYSGVDFKDGVNIIYGASNTGKSYVISCINFMFGAEDAPFTRASTGYDTIHMEMKSTGGQLFSARRKIVSGKQGDTGGNKINVTATEWGINNAEYKMSDNSYSALLLRLMGIQEAHDVIVKKDFETSPLKIRTIFHFFYLDEDNIFEKSTALGTPKYPKKTAMLTCLQFLFDGDDLNDLIPKEPEKERQRRITEKNAVIAYIGAKIVSLQERKKQLLALSRQEAVDENLEGNIDQIVAELADTEKEIHAATNRSKEYLAQMYEISSQIQEARYLQDRYETLYAQYRSDLKRLHFISKGDAALKDSKRTVICPFCNSDIREKEEPRHAYSMAAGAEAEKIKVQITDLKAVETDLLAEIQSLEGQLRQLTLLNDEQLQIINRQLQPHAAELKEKLDAYKKSVGLNQELKALEAVSEELNTDALNKEAEPDGIKLELDPKEHVNKEKWKMWSNLFQDIVWNCQYPGHPPARISLESPYDAIVGHKHKREEGKGYRAFLNTIVLFSLMKFLEAEGAYRLGILILDSPILSLKEKRLEFEEWEYATPGMKESLFQYIIQNCGNNQVIIAENELPDSRKVDYSTAKMIEFTLDEHVGRYGFLHEIVNTENV